MGGSIFFPIFSVLFLFLFIHVLLTLTFYGKFYATYPMTTVCHVYDSIVLFNVMHTYEYESMCEGFAVYTHKNNIICCMIKQLFVARTFFLEKYIFIVLCCFY